MKATHLFVALIVLSSATLEAQEPPDPYLWLEETESAAAIEWARVRTERGIQDGSNGGTLMGVAVIQRPALFGAAHANVPVFDLRRPAVMGGLGRADEIGDPERRRFTRPRAAGRTPGSGPVIDMHMHAYTRAWRGADGLPMDPPCAPAGCTPYPTVVGSHDDVRLLAIDAMDRNQVVLGVVTHSLERVYEWIAPEKSRFLAGAAVMDPESADTALIRSELEAGRLHVLGEIATQYRGFPPEHPANAPFFALAEEFGVPLLIHTSGWAGPSERYRIAHGHPERLEEVLIRHPDLRIWLENAAYPFLDEVIALMYRYPQVYADLSTITWIIPRTEFYRYLEALVGAGLGNRLMWGSDQMFWPGVIDPSLDAIREAPFLSEEQKRDILYNNAAQFLRLSEEEIRRHHGGG